MKNDLCGIGYDGDFLIGRRRKRLIGCSLLVTLLPSCTGGTETLSLVPAFEIATPGGLAGVSYRAPMPDLTDTASEQVIEAGMKRGCVCAINPAPVTDSHPKLRIVWHVDRIGRSSARLLLVNVFGGDSIIADDQQDISADTSREALVGIVSLMTVRLSTSLSALRSAEAGRSEKHGGSRSIPIE